MLVAGGAMLFASKGIIAKRLYDMGVGFEALVAIRALIALPLFWAFALSRDGAKVVRGTRPRAALAAALAGFLCYYLGALLDFQALTLIDASIERVLMFSYPAVVVLFTAVQTRRWPQRKRACPPQTRRQPSRSTSSPRPRSIRWPHLPSIRRPRSPSPSVPHPPSPRRPPAR